MDSISSQPDVRHVDEHIDGNPGSNRHNADTRGVDVRSKRQRTITGHNAFAKMGLVRKCVPRKAPDDVEVCWKDLGSGSIVGHAPRMLNKDHQNRILHVLLEQVPWRQTEVVLFGRPVMQPRCIAYMADDTSLGYTYSGAKMVVNMWHPEVASIRDYAVKLAGEQFNSCLLNLYRDGADYVGWHADDESVYGPNATICSLSLGEARDFHFRLKSEHSKKHKYKLCGGDAFVMKGTLQTFWQHCIPKRAGVTAERISLTFRRVHTSTNSSDAVNACVD